MSRTLNAKLIGCVEGARAAASLGISRLILETDATQVKAAAEGEEYLLSPFGGLVAELQNILFLEFTNRRVLVCPRSCNKAADAIAAFGCNLSGGVQTTWDVVPYFLPLWRIEFDQRLC